MIGQTQFSLKDGTTYDRAWFEDEEEAVDPVELEETMVYNKDGDALVVEHKAMQYGRYLSENEDDDTVEWLLVQAEDRGEDASIEIYVGSDLQEGEFRRVGSSKCHHANIRVIASTNVSLEENVHKGTFREDLYRTLWNIYWT